MAQLLVRKLDDSLKEKLRAQANAKGRSLEEEARAILKSGVGRSTSDANEFGWATKFSQRFQKVGLTDDEFDEFEKAIQSLRGSRVRPAEFE
jgi:antitoxin FitA